MSFSSCTAKVTIDSPYGGNSFTNLDTIQGKVNVVLKSETSIKSIVVKLEGVSRTTVPIPRQQDDRRRRKNRNKESKEVSIEIHKVLYRSQTVFPPANVRQSSSANQFTLPAGSYDYDFSFRIPVNTECAREAAGSTGAGNKNGYGYANNGPSSAQFGNLNGRIGNHLGTIADSLPIQGNKLLVSKTGVDFARAPHTHLEGILPPSLSGLGDTASVKYFVKVTVNRASLLAMNTRQYQPFILLPMDPPRLYDSTKMAFVRRQVTVGTSADPGDNGNGSGTVNGGGGFFSKFVSNQKVSSIMGLNAWPGKTMTFTFEMRFPSAGTFVPLSALPIELYAIFTSAPSSMTQLKGMYIGSLGVVLYARTAARAHEYDTEIPLKLQICDKNDLSFPLSFQDAKPVQRNGSTVWELRIPSDVLSGAELPDYVCPSFTTCNISRNYSLEVDAGFYCIEGINLDHVSLLSDIIVRSGINPPDPDKIPPGGASKQQIRPPQPPRPEKSSAGPSPYYEPPVNYNEAVGPAGNLPTYDDVVSETSSTVQQQAQSSRRKFGQSSDYYKVEGE